MNQSTAQASTQSATEAVIQAATAPSDKPLASKAYLDSVALDIQKQLGVLPEVVQLGDWLDSKKLSALPGIGLASADEKSLSADKGIAALAISSSESNSGTPPLALLQPSPPLKDFTGDAYVFRVIERSPAHAPPLAEVKEQVTADYIASHGYASAVAASKTLLEQAKQQGLAAAAKAANHPVVTTSAIIDGSFSGFDTSLASQGLISAKADELLRQATPQNKHPVALLELPADKKALVVELADVVGQVPRQSLFQAQLVRTRLEGHLLRQQLARDYFTYDAIRDRLGYTPEQADKSESGS